MKMQIQEMKNKEGVLGERAVFQKEIAEKFCQEFKNLLENKPQGKWEIIADGVIEKDFWRHSILRMRRTEKRLRTLWKRRGLMIRQ